LKLGNGAWGAKSYNDVATGSRKKSDDIFSCLDAIHERDGETDGRTPGDRKKTRLRIASRGKNLKLRYNDTQDVESNV